MITRTFNNQPTLGLECEYNLQRKAMVWSKYNPTTTKDILVTFRFLFTGGLAVEVLANVVVDNKVIGEFSTSENPDLQTILDAVDANEELPCCKEVSTKQPLQGLSYFDAGYVDTGYIEPQNG